MHWTTCPTCNGNRRIRSGDNDYGSKCEKCGGSGLVNGLFGEKDCPRCDGSGNGYKNSTKVITCPECDGEGGWNNPGNESD